MVAIHVVKSRRRAGAGYTAYDYELSKSLPPKEGVGTHTRAQQLERAARFLKAVVPEAEKRFGEALTERVKVSPLGAFFHTRSRAIERDPPYLAL